MKILHVIHSANPTGGGPIEGIKQLAGAQTELGHQVEVVSLDRPDAPWIKDFPLPLHPMGPSFMHYGYAPKLIAWLRVHRQEYDIVVVNGIWQFNSLAVWRVMSRSDTPYCVFTHGMLDPWFKRRYPLKHLKKWLYWPWGEYRVLRDADAVLFTCEEERIQARKSFWLYRCNEVVVNYGTAGPVGDSQMQRELFLEKYPVLRGKRVMLFLGRIHEKKGCDLLVDAFCQLCKKRPVETGEMHLVMAGPIQEEFAARIKGQAEREGLADRITWTGMLGGDLKWGAYHTAEVFALPSHQENFGISVAEAMACGVPVLISSKVNIWREIEAEQGGLVEEDDLAGAGKLLERWVALSEAERRTMGENARACFEKCFQISRAAERLAQVLSGVVEQRRRQAGERKK